MKNLNININKRSIAMVFGVLVGFIVGGVTICFNLLCVENFVSQNAKSRLKEQHIIIENPPNVSNVITRKENVKAIVNLSAVRKSFVINYLRGGGLDLNKNIDKNIKIEKGLMHGLKKKEEMDKIDIVNDYKCIDTHAFNGTIPGGLIRVLEGDDVEIRFSNTYSNNNSYSLIVDMENVPPMKEVQGRQEISAFVKENESTLLRFKAKRPGLYMYLGGGSAETLITPGRTGPNMATDISGGMYGMIFVQPKDYKRADREFYLMRSELYIGQGYSALQTKRKIRTLKEIERLYLSYCGFKNNGKGRIGEDWKRRSEAVSDRYEINQYTYYKFSQFREVLEKPMDVGFNGKLNQYADAFPLMVVRDETVRFFIGNVGPNNPAQFLVNGGDKPSLVSIYAEKGDRKRVEHGMYLAPGSAVIIDVSFGEIGDYFIQDRKDLLGLSGARMKVRVYKDRVDLLYNLLGALK
ncbi:MAG: hypothetical protein HYS16_00605 [Deltaproteobacteria bacterium]|nr:MAG: hypothetical protein HYS16_00605 [Deltaproteobacteria bacterium]